MSESYVINEGKILPHKWSQVTGFFVGCHDGKISSSLLFSVVYPVQSFVSIWETGIMR